MESPEYDPSENEKRTHNKKNKFNIFKKYKSKKSGLSIFERLNILNDKEKLLKMKNNDFMLLYCTKQNKETITYSLKQVESMMKKDPKQKEIIEDIIKNIRDR